jgi:hypothetical protein
MAKFYDQVSFRSSFVHTSRLSADPSHVRCLASVNNFDNLVVIIIEIYYCSSIRAIGFEPGLAEPGLESGQGLDQKNAKIRGIAISHYPMFLFNKTLRTLANARTLFYY